MIETSVIPFLRSLLLRVSGPCALVLALSLSVSGRASAAAGEKGNPSGKDVIQCGAMIGDSLHVRLADVLAEPDRFADKTVIFQGAIAEVCQTKGCWMKVVPDSGVVGVRVTFKDYGFFVPKDSEGMWVRAEGVFHAKVWSKSDADHLESDGARLVRNPDGTATELSFVAAGVELTRIGTPAPAPKVDSGESSNVRKN